MKRLSILALALACLDLVSCESISRVPPPVTAEMAKAPRISLARLREGRVLFVSRCIECHTLPPIWHYTAKEWPRLVDSMAHRTQLRPEEREAVVAYILAARKQ